MRAPENHIHHKTDRKQALLTFSAWLLLFTPSLLSGKTDLPLLFLLLSALLFWPLALLRFVRMPAVLVLSLLGAMNVLHSAYFGNLVDEYFIATSSRSDLQESLEYLSTLSWQICALVLGWLLLCTVVGRYLWRNGPALAQSALARRTAMAALLFWLVFLGFALARHWDAGDSLKKLRRLYPIHIAQAVERQNEIQDALFYQPALPDMPPEGAQARTLVVVLGESATAQRWSLLGYAQADTNAPLARLPGTAAAPVLAQGLTTSAALPFLLTGLSAHDSITQRAPSFLDWAQHAGYKVFVFTNSRFLNQQEDFSTQVLRRAAQVYKKVGNGELDEVLTPFLAQALQDTAPRKLVVLHTYGSHPDLPKRYPSGRYHLADAYDNSIRYTRRNGHSCWSAAAPSLPCCSTPATMG
ncbi:sulfatase-like hydrolase/transferase [Comamonas sp. GB3 AK4-5]|uniref:sulfatase-like hydrolase/transferase n=1 Tax=Comamonas sp. GB3 AK4-5 TaxID=3231487 RepID=UPI00351F3D78